MTDQQLPPGLLTAEEVLAAIRIKEDVGLDYGSLRVHVFDRATRRAIGVAMYDKDGPVSFSRDISTVGTEFAITADVLEGEYALRIVPTDLDEVPLRVSAKALLPGGTLEDIPEGQLVTWFVMLNYFNGEGYTRTEFNVTATDFELIDFAWPSGTITINVQLGNRLGAYVATKNGESDLEFIIDVSLLDGLHIPDDFYENVQAI